MQQDAWRTYLELALGLTEKPRKRARQVMDALAAQSGASVDQVRALTEELVETSLANREAVARMVRTELDRALGAVGLANAEELAELRGRVDDLERRLRVAEGTDPDLAPARPKPAKAAAKKAAKPAKTGAKKAAGSGNAPKTVAKKAAKKPAAKKTSGAKKAAGRKAAGA